MILACLSCFTAVVHLPFCLRWEGGGGMLTCHRPKPERMNSRSSVPTVHEEHDFEEEEWEEFQRPECTWREVQSPLHSPKPIVLKPAVILNSIIEENGADETEEVG